jgi:hypothetical protein
LRIGRLRLLDVLGTGWGPDKKALMEILGHRTAAQRAEIAAAYAGRYNESLLDRLHSVLSGDFRVIIPRSFDGLDDCRPDLPDTDSNPVPSPVRAR